ncbi:tetratricopeptide repeat protein [Archangium primigenium]|nr:tetratricopeptide repeat protein [Archangium primigenium]
MRPSRLHTRAVPLLVLLGWAATAMSAPRRAPVDRTAMREAIAAAAVTDKQVSPASYAHDLRAQLLSLEGRHHEAADALRLALATDEGNPYLLTHLGEEYSLVGDLVRAEAELRRVVALHPRYYPGRMVLARVLLEARRPARAEVQLRQAIRLKPREPQAYLLLAQLHLDARAHAQAVLVVEQLARALPGEISGYRQLGLALAERGDAERARRMLSRALERDPGDVESLNVLARLHEKAGALKEAEDALARALERDPDNAAMLESAGRLALRGGSSVRARAYFDRLLAQAGDSDLAVRVALVFLSAHDSDAALAVLDAAREGRGGSARLSFSAGLVHERMRHFARAAAAYAEVPDTASLASDARSREGICLSQAGEHARALALLRASLAERPGDTEREIQLARALERAGESEPALTLLREANARGAQPELLEALAGTLKRLGRAEQALDVLREAVSRTPRDPAPRYVLATVLLEQGDEAGALTWMRSVLRMEPDHPAALNFIGYLLAQRGRDFAEAERLVRRALALRPDTGSFLDSLGWIHYRRGDYARAVQALARAAELEPEEPVILEHLGDAYQRAARPDEAAGAWRRALEVLARTPEAAEPRDQRTLIERKLKMLPTGAPGR